MVEASLYFHIPFCRKKCPYCHFYVISHQAHLQKILLTALRLEWEQKLPELLGKKIVSVYFGGGTPTLLPAEEIKALIDMVKKNFSLDDAEITIEANPEEGNVSFFKELKASGINRLSIGVQSLDDASLISIGRNHGASRAKEAIIAAEKASISNVSIDLMYDLPNQTIESFAKTLDAVGHLPIHHLSLYNMTVEPNTYFFKKKPKQPDSETSLLLHNMAIDTLERHGFERYEISAFAKNGLKSRHNLGYWTARPFLGLGPSAFSYWDGKRFRNSSDIHKWARALGDGQSPIDFSEELPDSQKASELILVRLRLREGVNLDDFPHLPITLKKGIDKWEKNGFLEKEGKTFRLTKKGMLFYDEIAADLI